MFGPLPARHLPSICRISGTFSPDILEFLPTHLGNQDPDAVVDVSDEPESAKTDAETRAVTAFESVLKDAANIQYDHYLLYYSRK